jgi:hypothetical protein
MAMTQKTQFFSDFERLTTFFFVETFRNNRFDTSRLAKSRYTLTWCIISGLNSPRNKNPAVNIVSSAQCISFFFKKKKPPFRFGLHPGLSNSLSVSLFLK